MPTTTRPLRRPAGISRAADTIRVYRDWMYPLGEMIAELKALPPDPENMNNDRAALPAAHSPTPWLQNGKAIYYRLDCGLTENIATVHGGEFGNPHPNAAFIVRAVNNYADLLDALQFCDITLADLETSERKGYIAEAKKQARAAIAKATA
jgi:hypothetical protein